MRIVFRVHHRALDSEEVLVVGGLSRLGCWNPAKAVRLVKICDGLYQGTVSGISELDQVVEYKFLLRDTDVPGRVKWDNGRNRALRVSSDEIGVVIDEYPFRSGTSEWRNYDLDPESQERCGDFDKLKGEQSFWALWERAPADLGSASSCNSSVQNTPPSVRPGHEYEEHVYRNGLERRKRSIYPSNNIGDQQMDTAKESSYGHGDHAWADKQRARVLDPSQPRPKPLWMFDRKDFKCCGHTQSMRSQLFSFTSSTPFQGGRELMNDVHRDECSSCTCHASPYDLDAHPSPLYRSDQLSFFLLWRNSGATRLQTR